MAGQVDLLDPLPKDVAKLQPSFTLLRRQISLVDWNKIVPTETNWCGLTILVETKQIWTPLSGLNRLNMALPNLLPH